MQESPKKGLNKRGQFFKLDEIQEWRVILVCVYIQAVHGPSNQTWHMVIYLFVYCNEILLKKILLKNANKPQQQEQKCSRNRA